MTSRQFEEMANQNRILSVGALLGDHDLDGFTEILNLLPKMRESKCWLPLVGFVWPTMPPSANARTTKFLLTDDIGGKQTILLHSEGSSSVRNN